jgi:hypothetical protein
MCEALLLSAFLRRIRRRRCAAARSQGALQSVKPANLPKSQHLRFYARMNISALIAQVCLIIAWAAQNVIVEQI